MTINLIVAQMVVFTALAAVDFQWQLDNSHAHVLILPMDTVTTIDTTVVHKAQETRKELSKHLFADPQAFLKHIIATYIDETSGRDNLLQMVKEFNRKCPFMMLNDYRIAMATNSLRRIEVLRELIFF